MKRNQISPRRIFQVLFMIPLLWLTTSFIVIKKKECNEQELTAKGVDKLKNYSLIKYYPFNFREKKKNKPVELLKQVVTLTRGVKYRFYTVANSDFEGKPVISIYNNEKLQILFACSYNNTTQKFYDEISFECKTTGNYCLTFSFFDGQEGCAVGMMSFLE